MPMETLAVIPARGGSKGVPRKNIRLLAGEPLISYSIRAGIESRYVTRIVLTTEDDEIAAIGRSYGAEVPFLRPSELAEDSSRDLEVFQHCLGWLDDHEGYVPDIVVQLRPTAPLRTSAHIDEAIELFMTLPEVDCVRSVTEAPQHPLKTWRVENGMLTPFVPTSLTGINEPFNMPRQALGDAYIQNGSVDVIKPSVITSQNSMSGLRIRPMVMKPEDSVNIDSPLDWSMAEMLMAQRSKRIAKDVR